MFSSIVKRGMTTTKWKIEEKWDKNKVWEDMTCLSCCGANIYAFIWSLTILKMQNATPTLGGLKKLLLEVCLTCHFSIHLFKWHATHRFKALPMGSIFVIYSKR